MSTIDFTPFPKIPRLNRSVVISEKLDGTNAAVVIVPQSEISHVDHHGGQFVTLSQPDAGRLVEVVGDNVVGKYFVFAQSRNRFITPGDDNYGFAGYVQRNAEALVATLGAGTHFGEWWGSGIQRGYGLRGPDKRFSLFNIGRWCNADLSAVPQLGVVPNLSKEFRLGTLEDVPEAIERLREWGSVAAPGFARPEGVVVYHTALRSTFKVTLDKDEAPKGAAGHALDEEVKVAA